MSTSGASGREAAPSPEASPWIALTVWVGFLAGFCVALVAVARPRWFPILDLAQTEMRVRDVLSTNPPLIGLPGRIGTLARQGSHPGPLSFWALAPFYKVFGSSAWALQAAAASLNVIAIGASLLIVRRRGGTAVFLGFAAALAALAHLDGTAVLTQAWNPYLPMTWFIVFALGVWSVLCDDLAMLPFATFAASFCLHTHISYLGFVGGFGAVAVVWIAWSWWKRRPALGPRAGRWIVISAGIVIVTSVPPIIQQFTHDPGNLALIWEHFTNPPLDPIGLRRGAEVLLVHLNPWRLIAGQDATTGSVLPGGLLFAAWFASAIVAMKRRLRPVVALDALIAVALFIGLLSIANIFGFVWYYLMRWAWGINALMLVATGWTIVGEIARRGTPSAQRSRVLVTALALLAGVSLVRFAVDARTIEPPTPRVSLVLGELVRPTVRAIDAGTVPGGGRDGQYQITIVDRISINAPAYGLLSELNRDGIHAGLPPQYAAIVRDGRVVAKEHATAVLHLSVGPDIAAWEAKPGAVKIAEVDLRTPKEQREFVRLQARARRQLRTIGRNDLLPNIDDNIFTAAFADGLPDNVHDTLKRLLEIGDRSAIFAGPAALAE